MKKHLLFVVVVAALAACGPTNIGDDDNGGDDDGAAGVDGGPGGNGIIDAGPGGNPDDFIDAGACGEQTQEIMLIDNGAPPDLLIVLDRSGSMNEGPGFPPFPPTKWEIMKSALGTLMQSKQDSINFGLSVFPTDDNCGVSAGTAVSIAAHNKAPIDGWLASHNANGNTPAYRGLEEALATYNSIPVNPEGRFVLFATDGLPNCSGGNPDTASDAETVAAVQALHAQGIKTYVIGFGGFFGFDPPVLNDAAQAGGVPRAGGPPYFYKADNAAELEAVLNEIAGGIVVPSCTLDLASLPPDPDLVTVTFDGVPVPRTPSHADGWDYFPDGDTITFFGSACAELQSGAVAEVKVLYGCPGPVVE